MMPGILAVLICFAQAGGGSEPEWWDNGVKNGAPAADFALANQGQANWFATKAEEEFLANLPPGFNDPILPTLPAADNYLPINQGQLKNLATPFYERLHAAGQVYPELLQVLPASMPSGQIYPGTDATA